MSGWRQGRLIPCGAWDCCCGRDHCRHEAACLPVGHCRNRGDRRRPGRPPESHWPPSAARRPFAAAQMRGAGSGRSGPREAPPPPMCEIARRVGVAHAFLSSNCRSSAGRSPRATWLMTQCRAGRPGGGWRGRQRAPPRRDPPGGGRGARRGPLPQCQPNIAPLLSQPGFIRDHQARVAWQEALRELGWREADRTRLINQVPAASDDLPSTGRIPLPRRPTYGLSYRACDPATYRAVMAAM